MPAKLNRPRILTLITITTTVIVFFVLRAQNASFDHLALRCLDKSFSAPNQIEDCTKALEHPELVKPLERRLLLYRASLHNKDRNYEAAHDDLERAYEIYPHDLVVLKKLALVSARLEHYERAEQLFSSILAHDPNDQLMLQVLVTIIASTADRDIAIQKLAALSSAHPKNANVTIQLAQLLKKNKQYSRAAQYNVAALELNPKNVTAFSQLQSICRESPTHCVQLKGDYDRFPDCKKALENYKSRVPNFEELLTELTGDPSTVHVNRFTPESWVLFSIAYSGSSIEFSANPQPESAQMIGLLTVLLDCNDSVFVESPFFRPEIYAKFRKTLSLPIKHNYRVFAQRFK